MRTLPNDVSQAVASSSRRRLPARAVAALAMLGAMGFNPANAQTNVPTYPAKPIRLVVGFAPGGAADYVARVLAEPYSRALGQSVVVENRAGAGSSIAAEYVSKSAPDGYTILIASPSSISVNPAINPKLGYSPRDLTPVSKLTSSPLVVAANTSLGINSLKDLIATAKRSPGKLNFASSGPGSAPHLSAVLFSRVAGVEMVHVPFKGGAPAVQSVVAGDTQVTFGTPPSVLPLMQAGRLKGLATTGRARSPLVPDLPGMQEAGVPDAEIAFWYGLFVPAGTPPAIVKRLFDASAQILLLPEVKAAMAREGTEVASSRSTEEFASFLADDAKFWARLVRDAKVTAD